MTIHYNIFRDPLDVWHVEVSTTKRYELDRKTARECAKRQLQYQLDQMNAGTVAEGYKVTFARAIDHRESFSLDSGPAELWIFTERGDLIPGQPYQRQREQLAKAAAAKAMHCDVVSDNHSDDVLQVFNGSGSLAFRCGFHIQQYGTGAIS